jgi:hypothetical protein
MRARVRMLTRLCAAVVLAGAASMAPPVAARIAAQQPLPQPATAVVPQTIYVGDVFHAAVRIDLSAGARAVFPDTLLGGSDLEPAGRVEIRSDTLAGGGTRLTGLYPLTAWRTGEASLDPIQIRVLTDGGETAVTARFPAFDVSSVLPADTTGIEARPAKDVLGANRVMWPWLLGGLVLLLALIALYLWHRRRRPAAFAAAGINPRQAALAALSEARADELLRSGDVRTFYIELADTLRFYAATVSPVFARDRTTLELASTATAAAIAAADAQQLLKLLTRADEVKFAKGVASAAEARADWRAAREWVARVGPPPAAEEEAAEAQLEGAA